MSFTVFLGNLPAWVTADDIKGWLSAENLVADAIKVIRNPETQESKGFAFIEAPNTEEMNSIIRRFDRAPLEDRLLRANPAQPPKPKGVVRPGGPPPPPHSSPGPYAGGGPRSGHDHGSHAPAPHVHPRPAAQANPLDTGTPPAGQGQATERVDRPPRRGKKSGKRPGSEAPPSAFAEELAKVL
ncbi:MAG TPA: RNA-binding protein [Bryobacteraceae bacterium]|nr:RNA-binding protein [Bryobacteraceae bacterium]